MTINVIKVLRVITFGPKMCKKGPTCNKLRGPKCKMFWP